jgi:Kef-type K+ transport system membrane component KefB
MVQQPETAWQTFKRVERKIEIIAEAVLGPFFLMAGLGGLIEWLTDWTGKALIIAVVMSLLGIACIYNTLERLGWIGSGR